MLLLHVTIPCCYYILLTGPGGGDVGGPDDGGGHNVGGGHEGGAEEEAGVSLGLGLGLGAPLAVGRGDDSVGAWQKRFSPVLQLKDSSMLIAIRCSAR